jgi:hypothetical protein
MRVNSTAKAQDNRTPVEAAVPAANPNHPQATRLPLQQRSLAFTLAEVVVTIGVLLLLVFFATQLLKSASTVTTLGNKRMDADSQTRQLLDRMTVDFTQMVKRSDVDYYLKSSWFASGAPPAPAGITGVRTLLQPGNDTMAFYSTLSGYYPSTGSQSSVSLVAYRINAQNKFERMDKGLLWNAATPGPSPAPVVFMPIPLVSPVPIAELPNPTPNPTATPAWPEIASGAGTWSDSEVIGPQVFRFEYYYLLKGQSNPTTTATPYPPIFSDTPWDTRICACPAASPAATPTPTGTPIASPTPETQCCHYAPEGMQDVAAVVVTIAVIDPKSRLLVTDAQLARLNGADRLSQGPALIDWGNTSCLGCPSQTQWQTTPGLLLAQWRTALDANTVGLPLPAISGIRVYQRYLYLSPPTLLTP